ncbi:MAG: ABC transporter substrate-binding protein [Chloroflexi bacterium]|nr:ABC transporter substrate-binding protein [Chloroflexota bacterium]
MHFKRLHLMFLIIVIGLTAGAACGQAKESDKVRLALDWFPNANHAGLYVALDKGYFKEEGIDLEVYTPDDPATILVTVGAGKDDFGFEYQIGVLLARAKDVPVVAIAGVVQHPLNSVMALKASGISRPKDLIGKKVGYPGIPTDPPTLDTMLKSDGARGMEDVELVNVGYDLVPALISKRVDAIVGAYWTHESISAENQGYPVNIMRMEKWGVPDFYELVIVTSETKIQKNPELVQRFLKALKRGYEDAARNPQGSIDVVKRLAPEIDEGIDRPGVELLAPLWQDSPRGFGWQEESRWGDFVKWMRANGILAKELDVTQAFTNQFLPK